MAANLIAILFLSRDIAHREHLRTRNFAAHSALGDFYGDVIDLADKLAETYQGRNGLIDDIPLLDNDFEGAIDVVLEKLLEQIEGARQSEIGDDSCLQNIVDEIVTLYLRTLYKLRTFQ